MKNYGRTCDNCGKALSESDYTSPGSWSYYCSKCGFKYRHSLNKSLYEQLDEFLEDE